MNIGDTFTQSFELNDEVYSAFTGIFKDNNPLHTDSDFAQSYGFKEKVMHGNALGGFLSYFVGECLPLKNVVIQKQDMQFSNPVYLGDTITLVAQIEDYFESVKSYEIKYRFQNAQGKKVCNGKLLIGVL